MELLKEYFYSCNSNNGCSLCEWAIYYESIFPVIYTVYSLLKNIIKCDVAFGKNIKI